MASSAAPSGADNEPNDKEVAAAGSSNPLEKFDTTASTSKDVVEKFISEVLRPNITSTSTVAGSDQVAAKIKDIVTPPANQQADISGLKPDTKIALNMQTFIRQLVSDKGLKGAADLIKGMSPQDRAKLGGWDIQVGGSPDSPTFAIKKGGVDVTSVRGVDIVAGDGKVGSAQWAGRAAERFEMLAENPKFLKAALLGLSALVARERQPGGSLADPAALNSFVNAFNARLGPGRMELSANDTGLALKKVPGVTGDITADYTQAKTRVSDSVGSAIPTDTKGLRDYLKASQSRISDLAALSSQPGVDAFQLSEKFSDVLRAEFARTGAAPADLVKAINAGMPPAAADGTRYAARYDTTAKQIVFEKVDSTGKALQVLRRVGEDNLKPVDLATMQPDEIARRMAASAAEAIGVMSPDQRDLQFSRVNQWLKTKPELAPTFFQAFDQELLNRPETKNLKPVLKPADAAAGTGPQVTIDKTVGRGDQPLTGEDLLLGMPIPPVGDNVPAPIKDLLQKLDASATGVKRFTDAITDPAKLTGFKQGDTILRIAPDGKNMIPATVSAVDATGRITEVQVDQTPPGYTGQPLPPVKVPFDQFVAGTNNLGEGSVFVGLRKSTPDVPVAGPDVPATAAPVDVAKIMGPEAFATLTEPQKQNLAIMFDGNASYDAKLKAAEALFASGMQNFKINDNNGKQRNVTLQKSGILMHVFTTDDRGRTTIALRGVKRGDTYQQQTDKRGRQVNFMGDHFLKNGGENSVLNGKASDAPARPTDQPVTVGNTIKPNDSAAFQASMGRIFMTSDPTQLNNRSVVSDFTNFASASLASTDTPEVKAKAISEAFAAAVRAEALLNPNLKPEDIAKKFSDALGPLGQTFKVEKGAIDGTEAVILKAAGQGQEQVLGAVSTEVLNSPVRYFGDLVKAAKSPGEVARLFSNFTRIENSRNPAASAAELAQRFNSVLAAGQTGYSVDLNKYGTADNALLLFKKNAAGAQDLISRIDPRHLQVPGQQENVLQLAGRLAEPLSALQGEELKAYWQQVTSTMKDLDPAKRELLIKSLQAELASRPESKHLTITPNADSLSLNSNKEGKTEAVAQARYDAVVPSEVAPQPAVPGGAADLKKILGDQQLAGKTPDQLAALQAFFKPGAKPEEQLAAARALALSGVKSLKIQDGDKSRTLSFQVEKAGKRSKDSYVHVYATDDKGKTRIAIRGISDDKGAIRQQGRASYYGDVWTKQIGNKSILSGAAAPTGPAATPEVPKPASANPLSPLFKADQIKWDATAPVEPTNPLEPVIVPSPATITGAPFDAALSAKSLLDSGLDGRWFPASAKDDYDRIKSTFLNKTPEQIAQIQAEFFKQSNGVRLEAALASRFGANTSEFFEIRRLSEGDSARLARIASDLQQLTSGTGTKTRWEVEKDLRDTFASMTKADLAKFDAEYTAKYGKSVMQAIADAKQMTDPTRSMMQILADKEKGVDFRTAGDTITMSNIALAAKDIDMFKEVWRRATPEARQRFLSEGGEQQIKDKFGGFFGGTTTDQIHALDYAKLGTLSVEHEITGNTGGFGDTEFGIEAAIDKMTQPNRDSYFAGKLLAAKVAEGHPEPTDPKQKADYDYYKQINAALYTASKNAFWRNIGVGDFNLGYFTQNSRELKAYEDRIRFGPKGSFVTDIINKDGSSAKSEDQILAAIDTMSKERWEQTKANMAAVEADLRSMLESSLGTFGTDTAAVQRVMDAFKKKMAARDHNEAQTIGRTLAERMDAKKGFLGWGTDRGAILSAIANMDNDFITKYKSDEAFRLAADKSLDDGSLKGPELVAARRMLDRVLSPEGKPNPDVLDKLIMFRAAGTPLKEMVVELDKMFRDDPQAFAKFQALSGKVAGYDLASIRREVMDGVRDDHDGNILWSSLDYAVYLSPMLERGKPLDADRRMQMYMGMFGNDMEGITKAVVAGGPDLWKQLKENPNLLSTWNPLYKFDQEQSAYIQKLAELQASLPPDKQGTIPPEFKIRLAILVGKGDQIKQETEAIPPQDRNAVIASYNKTFGRVLTDDLIKGRTPEGQAAAINFSGPLTMEQASDATRSLVYGNMGGRWWTSNFSVTAAQVQDRVDQLVVASTDIAVTKMDLPLEQRQILIDRALQTYVNYKQDEHAVVDAGADAAFAAVGIITFIPAVAGALETGGASLYAWGAGMAAIGAVMRPGVKAALLGGQYDWRRDLAKDATVGAIELPTYVLGPGLILKAGKVFVEPAINAVKALRLAGNPELASLTASRVASVIEVAPKLVTTAGDDIAARAVARVTARFEGLTGDSLALAVRDTTQQVSRKAFTEIFSDISKQLTSSGMKPFSKESVNLAANDFSEQVLTRVMKDVGAHLAGDPRQIQALVKESINRVIREMSESGAFSAESVLKALAAAEIDSAAQQGITQLMRQGFARAQDIPEKDILDVALKLTGNNPSQAALLAKAISAQIPNTAELTSKNMMELFIKTYPNFARSFAHTAPASFAGLASGASRYEWDPALTFEQNMTRMSAQAAMGAFIALAMVGTFTVPGAALKAWRGNFKGTGVAFSEVRDIAQNVEPKILGKLEDGRPVRFTEGGSVRIASNTGAESNGILTVAARDVDSSLVMSEGKTFLKSSGEVPPQIFRNGTWEKLAPDEVLELQHGQMIKFGPEGKAMVFMRTVEKDVQAGYLLPVPELNPSLLKRMVPAVVEEAGFQPGSRLRITPGRDVVKIGGEGADVVVGSARAAGEVVPKRSTYLVEASMPVTESKGLFRRLFTSKADDVAPLATKGEVNLRNIGEGSITVIRKDAKGNILGHDVYPDLKALKAEAAKKGTPLPTEAPKFALGRNDEVLFPRTSEKFKAYSQNGAIRFERLANAGSDIPAIRTGVATVLRASADDMGRLERVINAVRNRGSDVFESARSAYTKVADQIKSGELIDRLRYGGVLGRVLRKNDFETAATMTDKKLISLGFGIKDAPVGFKGTVYRNYQTGVEIWREGNRVVQVTANGRTLKINWSGDKVASFLMPDGTLRSAIPFGGKFKAPSLRELPELADGQVRLYRATYSPSEVDLASRLTAKELKRLERLAARLEEKGSLNRFQKAEYDRLLAIRDAGRTRTFYRSPEEAIAAAGKGKDGVGPTIFVHDMIVKAGRDIPDVVDLPTIIASRAKQHPHSFTNNLNDGTWMVSVAEASAASHYSAQITRDVGFRINANGFSFLSGFSDAGMFARAKAMDFQKLLGANRGIASKPGISHVIHAGERIDIGTALGSEILSKNRFVLGRTASLLKTKDGLRLVAGEGDVVVIRNGAPVVLKDGLLMPGDRIIVGKAVIPGLYKGDEFVVAIDNAKSSILQHNRSANYLGYLYAGGNGTVPVGLMASVAKRNLSTAATAIGMTLSRTRQTTVSFFTNAFELGRHIRAALREGRINRGLEKGKEYTIFGNAKLAKDGGIVKLTQLKENEPIYIVRNVDGIKRTFYTHQDKPFPLEKGDLLYRGRKPDKSGFVGNAFEYRGVPVKAERVPIGERVRDVVDSVRSISVTDSVKGAFKAVGNLHLGTAVVNQIKRVGYVFRRTPKAPVEGGMTWRERFASFSDRIRTAQANMAAVESSITRAPLTEAEKALAELAAAIKANGLGEPVQAYRLRPFDAKAKPVALHKDGTAITFAKADGASDLVPTFNPLKDVGSDKAQVVIKNDGGRRTVVVPEKSDAQVFIKRPGQDPVRVVHGKPETGRWQEGDKLIITRGDMSTSLSFEKSSRYRRVVQASSELSTDVGREGMLKKVWAASPNWWSLSRRFLPTIRRKAAEETETALNKIKVFKPNRKDSIKIDSSTSVKIVKSDADSTVSGEISSTAELLVKRGKNRFVPETSGKATLQPGDRFKIGAAGKEHIFTGKSVERITPKERIFRRGAFREMYRRWRNPEAASINIIRKASDTASDSVEGVGNFYRVRVAKDSKPIAIANNGSRKALNLDSLPFNKEPHAFASAKLDGDKVTAIKIEPKSDVPMFVTNAQGNVLTRVKAGTELTEGSFLKIGDEVFHVVRDGNDLILDQVQATKLTQSMMRPANTGAVEVVEKSFLQANRAEAADVASRFEIAGSATSYKIKGSSFTIGAEHVAVINKSELSEFAAKQAKFSFEPEGIFVEALSEKPVYILRKGGKGTERPVQVLPGERHKFDPDTMTLRLGDEDNHGRSLFSLRAREVEPKSSPAASTAVDEAIPATSRTTLPEGEYRAPRVVPLDNVEPSAVVLNLTGKQIRDNLRDDVARIIKSNPADLAAELQAALAKVDFEKVTPMQVAKRLNETFRNVSAELRLEARSSKGKVIIETISPGKVTTHSFAPKHESAFSNIPKLEGEAKGFAIGYRDMQLKGARQNVESLVRNVENVINEMSVHSKPEHIVQALNDELNAYNFLNRLMVSYENGQYKVTVVERGRINHKNPLLVFDSAAHSRVATVENRVASLTEQEVKAQMDNFQSAMYRLNDSEAFTTAPADVRDSINRLLAGFHPEMSPEAIRNFVDSANDMFKAQNMGNRFRIEFDAQTGKLSFFDNEAPPLVKSAELKINPRQITQDQIIQATADRVNAVMASTARLKDKLEQYIQTGSPDSLNELTTALRALGTEDGLNASEIVYSVNNLLRDSNLSRKLRLQVQSGDELAILRFKEGVPVAEVDTVSSAAYPKIVPEVVEHAVSDVLVSGADDAARATLNKDLVRRLNAFSAPDPLDAVKVDEIRNNFRAYLSTIKPEAVDGADLPVILMLAERRAVPLSDLRKFYSRLLESGSLSQDTANLVRNLESNLDKVVNFRARQIEGLLKADSVPPARLAHLAMQNSDPEFLTEQIGNNLIQVLNKNIGNISSSDVGRIINFVEQALAKHPTLATEAEALLKALQPQQKLFATLQRLERAVPSSRSASDLIQVIESSVTMAGDNTRLLDDAGLKALAGAVRKGHMTAENSEQILTFISTQRGLKAFSDEAENAFATAHFELLAKQLGVKSKGVKVISELADLVDENTKISPQLIETLTTMARTGKLSPEQVSQVSRLVSKLQSNTTFKELNGELKGAFTQAIHALERETLNRPKGELTLNGSVAIGEDIFSPTHVTESAMIPGAGEVHLGMINQSLINDFEIQVGRRNTMSLKPGEIVLLRNSESNIPYKSVIVVGDAAGGPVKLSDNLAAGLLKLERDRITSVTMPVFRLGKLRRLERDLKNGITDNESIKFTEDELIKEYEEAIRKFRASSNGTLKDLQFIVTSEEAKFGERLSRAIENVMREPVMGAPGLPDNAAALPQHLLFTPPVKDGK
ncbi:MAG: hypothetical protein KIT34_03820 [Cyanobacteria bacterium TGS_CYA1]|nr:hypothetical protein [Cyanobacteria bacterium TGS_CYA1]